RPGLGAVAAAAGTPYPLPAGASAHPLVGVGFASWAHEVVAQEQELGVFCDTVIVCVVTGSTQAGMIAGFAEIEDAGGRPRRVIGTDASPALDRSVDKVSRIAQTRAARIGLGREILEV